MKTLTKILSAFLAGCMLITLCACHGKDETALTIEDEKITSALYLNALIECDSEARGRVDEQIAAAKENETENTEEAEEAVDEAVALKQGHPGVGTEQEVHPHGKNKNQNNQSFLISFHIGKNHSQRIRK